ncbi:hypothetical protein PAAG_12271 [Paracoccidioides lutzii Pb01]|uniref:Uncharacterized protein n=1 Tax=Paracoccidioides lutzii (strain ATCC MYA-826 / Pb01) TaxID=502779 RepID=A0A0A2V4D9_PARBA|nr:hypothetical protein PAAG_12271 [Paracoccidioides lutzii Pb01]KGQ01020.1 hypothetical protein PAAG_12271 [Paracoccidioides lutzii Pb01]
MNHPANINCPSLLPDQLGGFKPVLLSLKASIILVMKIKKGPSVAEIISGDGLERPKTLDVQYIRLLKQERASKDLQIFVGLQALNEALEMAVTWFQRPNWGCLAYKVVEGHSMEQA